MSDRDVIEFYNKDGVEGRNLVASVNSAMALTTGSFISIRGEVWKIVRITYALDYADKPMQQQMRANVDLRRTALEPKP